MALEKQESLTGTLVNNTHSIGFWPSGGETSEAIATYVLTALCPNFVDIFRLRSGGQSVS